MALEEQLAPLVAALSSRAQGIFLWGSHARSEAHAGSDVDICVVAGPGADLDALHSTILRALSKTSGQVDVKIFEDLPLYLQGGVIEEGRLLWTRDVVALEDHLLRFRKLWRDARIRLDVSADEYRRALAG